MAKAIRNEEHERSAAEASSGTHRISDRPTPPFDLRQFARSSMKLEPVAAEAAATTVSSSAFVDLASVPHLLVEAEHIESLELNHREGFLLSLVDDASTVEMILDICGMPEDEALFLFYELELRGVISLG